MRGYAIAGLSLALALGACMDEAPLKGTGAGVDVEKTVAAHKGDVSAKQGSWEMLDGDFDSITYSDGTTKISLKCAEAAHTLVITASPGAPAMLSGDTPATVILGKESFSATVKAGAHTTDVLVATLPANATTVTALMFGDNITLKLAAPEVERTGKPSDTGVFDLFATTCRQVNGL
jgi:hypothetical protein